MSTEVVKWSEELAKHASAEAAAETLQASSISLKAGVMTYRGQPVVGNKLDVVIVGAVRENQYFPERYDPNNIQPPLCWALGIEAEGMKPDPALVTEVQNTDPKRSGECADCPQFEWGSDPNGGRGKACKEKRRLALVPVSALETGIMEAELALLTVPVMSVANWSNYVNKLKAAADRPAWSVITTVAVVPDPKSQFRVTFTYGANVADEHLSDLLKKKQEAEGLLFAPYPKRTAQEEPKETKKRKY